MRRRNTVDDMMNAEQPSSCSSTILPALVLASTEPEGTVTEAVTEGGRERERERKRGEGAQISYYFMHYYRTSLAYIVGLSY